MLSQDQEVQNFNENFEQNFEDLELNYKYETLDVFFYNKLKRKKHGFRKDTNLSTKTTTTEFIETSIDDDIIPFSQKIFYSLPAFAKISCIIILK